MRHVSQKELFAALHEREFRLALGAVRCLLTGHHARPDVGRALARAVMGHECLMQEVLPGDARRAPTGIGTDADLLASCEHEHLETRRRLAKLSERSWEEPVAAPGGFALWPAVRRGEMLWMALRELVEQVEVSALAAGDALAPTHGAGV